MSRLGEFQARALDGSEVDLSTYDGRVVLVVNTASQCGYASQFPGLQQLHDDYRDQEFAVLGFPSDQFKQEPLDDDDLGGVCERNFGVSFPIFAKVAVNGRDSHPLFAWLRSQKRGLLGGRINWNFTKFLVDRDGQVVARYGPATTPDQIAGDVEKALADRAA